jgi:endonuclease/exonuclease/phosphatase (EEP) superfamily protein YafD
MGGTYQGDLPFLRIDQMWHSPIFECVSYKTIGVALSDHRPVMGEFVLPSSE